MAVTIRDIRVICTAPEGINLVVVKVETSEPGLYGLEMCIRDSSIFWSNLWNCTKIYTFGFCNCHFIYRFIR